MVKKRQTDQLFVDYPELTKGNFGGFEVGDGWYGILDTLCGLITHHVNYHNKDVEVRKQKAAAGATFAPELLEEYKMPHIEQVKEKFGTLRFYVSSGDSYVHRWIEFAEAMSACVCENCGKPGKQRSGGWILTLCDECNEKHVASRNQHNFN